LRFNGCLITINYALVFNLSIKPLCKNSIAGFGEKNFSELRDQLDINPATLSKKLKLLNEIGLISSDRTHDHLRVYYSISQHHKPIRRFLDAFERLANDL
jgi:DNA-binding HxlR family transcriptional regulator